MSIVANESGQVGIAILLLIVLAGVISGGMYMLDSLGLIHAEEQLYAQLRVIPYVGEFLVAPPVAPEEVQLDRLRQRRQQLNDIESKLSQQDQALERRRQQLRQQEEQLEEREQELESRERALLDRRRRFEEEEERIEYLAGLYGNMRPQDAADRLEAITRDRIVIGILQSMEQAGASIVLSNMTEQRAGVISRKMAQFPPGDIQ